MAKIRKQDRDIGIAFVAACAAAGLTLWRIPDWPWWAHLLVWAVVLAGLYKTLSQQRAVEAIAYKDDRKSEG